MFLSTRPFEIHICAPTLINSTVAPLLLFQCTRRGQRQRRRILIYSEERARCSTNKNLVGIDHSVYQLSAEHLSRGCISRSPRRDTGPAPAGPGQHMVDGQSDLQKTFRRHVNRAPAHGGITLLVLVHAEGAPMFFHATPLLVRRTEA